jgi:hypothetical protein
MTSRRNDFIPFFLVLRNLAHACNIAAVESTYAFARKRKMFALVSSSSITAVMLFLLGPTVGFLDLKSLSVLRDLITAEVAACP